MKCNKEDVLTKSVPFLSVIFFALFPILALYAHNAGQLVLSQLLMPVVFSLTLSAIIFFLWFAILKNILQASIVTVLFLVVFWNYGLLYSGIVRTLNLKHWHLIPLLFFIYLHIAYFVTKINRQKTLFDLNAILFFPVTLLIVFNLITIFPAEYKKLRTEGSIYSINGLGSKSTAIKNYPDIYIIICDEYASLKTIREEWGYDNSAFANFLKDKGFFVAENSKARFNQTTWNISCLLNLNYITGPVDQETFLNFIYDPESIGGSEAYSRLIKIDDNERFQKINSNILMNYLKSHGYQIVILEGLSQYYTPFHIQNADISFSYQDVNKSDKYNFLMDAFYMELIRKSILLPFDILFTLDQNYGVNYAGTKYVFNYLETEKKHLDRPKFTYAHILCPHVPFIFDRKGNYVSPIDADDQHDGKFIAAKNTVNEAYLEQYIYVTNEIEKIVNHNILKTSAVNPIIILQCDHGPRPISVYLKDKTNSFRIFNAVYFPDRDYHNIYDSIAPVNTLRVVLNKYFGESYKMLEEK